MRHLRDSEGIDALVVVEVHALEAVEIELAEVVLGDHGQTDTLGLLLLLGRLLRGDLELAGVEFQKVGFRILLRLLLLLRLLALLLRRRLRCDGLLVLLWGWLLQAREHGWVVADVLDERREGRVAKQGLDEAAVTLILVHEGLILGAETVAFLCLESDFAFELPDVFCE